MTERDILTYTRQLSNMAAIWIANTSCMKKNLSQSWSKRKL